MSSVVRHVVEESGDDQRQRQLKIKEGDGAQLGSSCRELRRTSPGSVAAVAWPVISTRLQKRNEVGRAKDEDGFNVCRL